MAARVPTPNQSMAPARKALNRRKKPPQRATVSEKSIGLKHVAKMAGVSLATVSRAINNPASVSDALRGRIDSVIEHLDWVPDGAARALRTRTTRTIGAVFPALLQGDFARCIEAMQRELATHGYTLLLAFSEYQIEQEYVQIRKMVERGVDALVLVGENHHPDLLRFLKKVKKPVINTFVYRPTTHGTCIGPDNYKALKHMTEYLLGLGHREFAVVAQSTENNDRAKARLEAIRDTLAQRGIAIRPQHFVEGKWRIEEGRELFGRIVASKPLPTAVICGNSFLSVGALLESQALGIKVPEQMSIVGYDDIDIMQNLPVTITTVRVASAEIGQRAALHLIARLEGKEEEIAYECDATIVKRQSSGPAPKA